MPAVLILGFGNPLRSDDGAGWRVAEMLQKRYGECRDVRILTVHQLTPELAEAIAEAGLVFFIDAAIDCGEPGRWVCEPVDPIPATRGALGHHLTPATLLACAQALFVGCRPIARLISIAAASFEYGESLSPAVEAVLPEIVEFLAREVYLEKAVEP